MRRVSIMLTVACAGLLVFAIKKFAGAGGKDQGPPVIVEESGSPEVDALVSQLVSRRPAPYPDGYFLGYFREPRITAEVDEALHKLKQMGPRVFPYLYKHLEDDRYSFSTVTSSWINHDVGYAVVNIFADGHTDHSYYKSRKTPSGVAGDGIYISFQYYLKARNGEKWAEWAKTRTRLEIQMDFIDWCVEQENERGYVDEAQKKETLQEYEDGRLRMKEKYSGAGGVP